MAKKEQEEVFYVGLRNPKDVRRYVLESTRDLVLLLRSFESLKHIRMQKVELQQNVQKEIAAIKKLVLQLKRNLPQTRLREEVEKPKKKEKQATSHVLKKHYASDVERLEAELTAIEEKLQTI